MFLAALFVAFKFGLCIVAAAGAIGILIAVFIAIGAIITAMFKVFPVACIVLTVIISAVIICIAAYYIISFIKRKREKSL